jgi:hypothetical protein
LLSKNHVNFSNNFLYVIKSHVNSWTGLTPLDARTWLNGTCIGYGSFSIALHSVLDGIQKDSSSFGKDQAFDNSVQEHRIGDIHYF